MEHYRKVSSQYIEDAPLPNEIRVLSSASITELVSQIIRTMNENLEMGVVVSACGSHVTKVVTIVEKIKSKYPDIIKQHSIIKYNRVEDLWTPDMDGLDELKVVRRIPVLSITLNVTKPLDIESIQKPQGTSAPHTRKSHVTRNFIKTPLTNHLNICLNQ